MPQDRRLGGSLQVQPKFSDLVCWRYWYLKLPMPLVVFLISYFSDFPTSYCSMLLCFSAYIQPGSSYRINPEQ